jgi:release factor glutamine methyltransferase
MTLKQWEDKFWTNLATVYNQNEAKSLFSILIEHICGWDKINQLLHQHDELTFDLVKKLDACLQELVERKPIQYVIGQADFMGLTFYVNHFTLIPRQETEELVHWISKDYAENEIDLIDIGTGSGCIPITLKARHPKWNCEGLDVSKEALLVARKNAEQLNVKVDLICSDIAVFETPKQHDVIVSNPPYVLKNEANLMLPQVLDFEPHLALFVEDNHPLYFYDIIANFALKNLKQKGALYFEINEKYGNEIIEMLKNKGFISVILRKDMNGKDRMVKATC